LGIGDWGWEIGDWGLGIGPIPKSQIHNPQSPIPIPIKKSLIELNNKININKVFNKIIKI